MPGIARCQRCPEYICVSDVLIPHPNAPTESRYDVVIDVPATGPYGTHTFPVPARTNWVNSGLYLRSGQTAHITATGTWNARGRDVGPAGDPEIGMQRGCAVGQLVARSDLRFEEAVTCIGADAMFAAPHDGILYLAIIDSTDLGEGYAERDDLDGALTVTVTSTGDTVPSISARDIASYAFERVASGWVELRGAHNVVTIAASQAHLDRSTAVGSLATLDAIWEQHAALRGASPFFGQRIRWYPDDTIASVASLVAGNPVRCVPELMNGLPNQRILRASEGATDIWGFAHELGHTFGFIHGTWVYQINNVESWPNIFTLHALRSLGRTAGQPHVSTYCDGRAAYLAGGDPMTFREDPFLQLCFLEEFEVAYPGFYSRFFRALNTQTNDDVHYDDTAASAWRYVRDRFNLAAGEDTTPRFVRWRVPL